MSDLFRKEVLNKQEERLFGDVLIPGRVSYTLLVFAILTIFILLLLYLSFGNYSRTETVSGYLSLKNTFLKVYSPQSAIIDKILVREGQSIKKGQDLLVLRTSNDLFSENESKKQQIKKIEEQIGFYRERYASIEPIYFLKNERMLKEINSKKEDIRHLNNQLEIIIERILLQRDLVKKLKDLSLKKHVPVNRVNESVSVVLELESLQQEIERKISNLNNEIELIRINIEELHHEKKSTFSDLNIRVAELEADLTKLESDQRVIIKADKGGYIGLINAHVGKLTSTNSPILTILPEERTLVGELLVPTKAIGFLEVHQKVLIRYDSFPFQKFGLHNAKVSAISESFLLPIEARDIPMSVTEPVFKIRLDLENQFISAYGKKFELKPGMQLQADIKLEDRNLLEWLLDPIYSLKGRLSD